MHEKEMGLEQEQKNTRNEDLIVFKVGQRVISGGQRFIFGPANGEFHQSKKNLFQSFTSLNKFSSPN